MQTTLRAAFSLLVMLCGLNMSSAKDANDLQNLGVGHVHMDISCSPAVSRNFDKALALLHNFWYPRALSTFDQVIQADLECAMAYWGAPTQTDEQSAWALVQKGMKAKKKSPREEMYIEAVGALYREGGIGKK